jgi:hypothetical protein
VDTPRGIASVRGSYMSVWVQKSTNDIIVCCLEGSCTFKNSGGLVNLTTGQKIVSSDTNIKPAVQPMDQGDMQDWQENSPESIAIVTQVAPLAVTSTPTFESTAVATFTPSSQSLVSLTSTIMPGATLPFYATPGILTTPYPTEYAGFDPALVEKCLSYGYTSEKMVTCLINLSLTLTP